MDRVKTIAFKWSTHTYVYEAGAVQYIALPDMEEWQMSDGKRNSVFNWLDIEFILNLGYLDQQQNAGKAYICQNGNTTIPSAPAAGIVTVLNALMTNDVEFFPILEDNAGNVHNTTKYKVILVGGRQILLDAETNGRFNPYSPIKLITKTPLQAYPSWLNR